MSISTITMLAGGSQQPIVGKALGAMSKPADAVVNAVPALKPGADVKGVTDVKPGKPDVKQVQQSLDDINKVMASFAISVQFQIDPDYKDLIVKVVDLGTGQLIRQIPTEDVVKMSKAMDSLKGLLFAQSV